MRNVRSDGRQTVTPDVTRALLRLAAGLLAELERLDDIADPDVVVVLHRQTTLEALADLGCVVLEPLERGQLAVLDDHRAVADQPDLRVPPDQPVGDPTS